MVYSAGVLVISITEQ